MSDDGLRDDPEPPGEPEDLCPDCALVECDCEDKAMRGGKPEIREHGDLPHRNTGDSSAPAKKEREETVYINGREYAVCMVLGCGAIQTHGNFCQAHWAGTK